MRQLCLLHSPTWSMHPVSFVFCAAAVTIHLTSLRWWISSESIFLWFIVDSLDHQCCGWMPRPALAFDTVQIISFILRTDSVFSTAFFAFHFWPVITEGWAFFTSGSRESCSIWKSRALPNLNFSTSDNVGSFSFIDELYSATFFCIFTD